MNEEERALLTDRVANRESPITVEGTIKWVVLWFGGLVLCGFVLSLLFSAGVNPFIGGVVGGVVGCVAIICLYAIIMLIGGHRRWSRLHREFVRDEIPKIQKALEVGAVFVKKVSASAVITIIEFEDEGSGYIYDVGDGRILFLKGQRFYPVNDSMSWPNSEFEIVTTVHGDIWIGIFCSGHELIPVREFETSDCVDELLWAEREDILDGEIEQFARSLTKEA
jgi:hypothetical protein